MERRGAPEEVTVLSVNSATDYMYLWGAKRSKFVFFDIQRAVDQLQMTRLAATIEQMGNGVLSSSKYTGQTGRVQPPKIVVVGNVQCPMGILSEDRILSYRVTRENIEKDKFF